jgi:carboxymethylenebutenolidase
MAMAGQLTTDLSKRDVEAFLSYGKKQPQVNPNKIGAVGYCMGGGQLLRAAGNFPNEIRAVASFHAGNLATDAENSPHRWFETIKAEVIDPCRQSKSKKSKDF